mgnify:CR=1 FL=1
MPRENPVVGLYAGVLAEAAKEAGASEAVEQELGVLLDLLGRVPAFQRLMQSPRVPIAAKRAAADRALAGFSPVVRGFFRVVLSRRRAMDLMEILDEAEDDLERARGVVVASLETAAPLSTDASDALRKALERRLGRPVIFEPRTVSALVAGVRIRCGDTLVEQTVARSVSDLKEACGRKLGTQDVIHGAAI